MNTSFDFCILGAGLAGISLAYELSKENASVCIVDPNGIASGASGTPLGLVNPGTGRYAALSWKAEACYSKISKNLEFVQKNTPVQFYAKTGVLRPALSPKIASRMKENYDHLDWPDGWIEWKDEEELKAFHPGISCTGGGVWLPIGLTVDISTYLKYFANILSSEGISQIYDQDYSISEKEGFWELIYSEDHTNIKAKHIVFTAGAFSIKSPFWEKLPLYPVKGQLAVLESDSPLSFKHAVSAQGYTASLNPNQFVVGSTYEHSFEHQDTDEQGLDYLLKRFNKVLPGLLQHSKVIHQWAAIRASTPNRMPILGRHPHHPELSIFAGLGSKGLLYSGYLSEIMKEFLVDGKQIPEEISINRLNFQP